jgi:hypothetical protein
VTHHRDVFRSGVARVNELHARELGDPQLGLDELGTGAPDRPLLSFKVGELDPDADAALAAWLATEPAAWDLFLHDYGADARERALVEGARRIHCGNHEIAARIGAVEGEVDVLWTPGLVLDERLFTPAELSVFSFGMAHKLRIDAFRRLRELLDATAASYVLYVSAANHETASLRDAQLVFEELHGIFPDELFFLGNLSDVAVSNYLRQMTYYAAFFPSGVRANNTSVAYALERGAVVLTNLDEHSPPEYVHGENVIDIERTTELPRDPLALQRLSAAAAETARTRTWDRLVERIR